jgi:hypothetical protein
MTAKGTVGAPTSIWSSHYRFLLATVYTSSQAQNTSQQNLAATFQEINFFQICQILFFFPDQPECAPEQSRALVKCIRGHLQGCLAN